MKVAWLVWVVACGDNGPSHPIDARPIDAAIDATPDANQMLHCYAPRDCTDPAKPICCIHYSPGGALEYDQCMANSPSCGEAACDPNASACAKSNGQPGTCMHTTLSSFDPTLWYVCL